MTSEPEPVVEAESPGADADEERQATVAEELRDAIRRKLEPQR